MDENEDIEVQADEPTRKGGFIPLVAALVLTLGGGGAVGAMAVGPKVGSVLAARATAAPKAKKGGHGGGHGEGETAPLHVVDNLVVNPAGSGGSRFLLTSIALETASAAEAEELKTRDLEIRDVFLLVLGSKTVEQLSDIAARPALSRELLDSVQALVGEGVVERILIPQFVIQ